jgi:hypothetical protein
VSSSRNYDNNQIKTSNIVQRKSGRIPVKKRRLSEFVLSEDEMDKVCLKKKQKRTRGKKKQP